MVKSASVVVMIMSQDHGGDICGGVQANLAEAWADLFVWRNPDADLLREEGVPPRQVAWRGVLRAVPGIHDVAAFGCSISQAKISKGPSQFYPERYRSFVGSDCAPRRHISAQISSKPFPWE